MKIKAKIGERTGLKKNTKDVVLAEVFSIALKKEAYPRPVTKT